MPKIHLDKIVLMINRFLKMYNMQLATPIQSQSLTDSTFVVSLDANHFSTSLRMLF